MPDYQDKDIFQPGFQRVCQPDCAITDSDGAIEIDNVTLTRRALFDDMREIVARQIATGADASFDPEDPETISIYMAAQACVRRIAAGDCAKFLLNTGQYPERSLGMMSYKAAERTLGIKNDQ